jgi:hypothetical protein
MNAALAMIEKLSNEFEQAHPRFKDSGEQKLHLEIIEFVYSNYSKSVEGPAFIDAEDEDDGPFAYNEGKLKWHSSTVLCTHTTELLLTIFTNRDKLQEYRLSNNEQRFLKCISQLASAPDIQNVIDGYIVRRAAITMLHQRRLNSWIIFSLQIFWDMQRELGSCMSIAKLLLDKTAQHLSIDYQAYLEVKGLERIGITHRFHRNGIFNARTLWKP